MEKIAYEKYRSLILPATGGIAEIAEGILGGVRADASHYTAAQSLIEESYRVSGEILAQLAQRGHVPYHHVNIFSPSQIDSYGLRRAVLMYSRRFIQLAYYIDRTFNSWNLNVDDSTLSEFDAIGDVMAGGNGPNGLAEALEYVLVADRTVFPPVRKKLGISTPFGDF